MSMKFSSKGPLLGIRHLQVILLLIAIFIQIYVRFSVSISVVAMTNSGKLNPNFEEFKWNTMEINYILGGFFWGFTITQFPGSFLCRLYGVKIILFASVLGSSVFAFITPFCVPLGGWRIFCSIRFIQGLFQGLVYPCIHNHLANWSPIAERNFLGGITLSGQDLGALVAMFGSGLLASSNLGWPGIFYISGAVGIGWCFVWLMFGSNSPSESNWISHHEQKYLIGSIDKTTITESIQKIPVPWRAIWTSSPFWALLVSVCAEAFGFTTLEAQIPSYLDGVLEVDINKNGLYSSLPYLALWLMGFVYLFVSIVLLKKKVLTLTILRRTFNTLALWLPAVGFIGIGFIEKEHKLLAIILLTVMMGLHSGTTIGSSLNTLDLSPNHAGMLVGVLYTLASGFGILSPLTVGLIVHDQHDRRQWQLVFIISALVFFLGNLFYTIFGSTEVQLWNDSNFLPAKGDTHIRNKDIEKQSK
ncbi:putative inorganic phosphate cotransporter [Eupeodes corollae]|uniref:putative inorganic phosphate cotransporter n=1 Tax=Eupeodes corollae TaxID=290404 RepID=UPI0024908775|nr:putative inorganic phosphate cotransporter [Eupeodes corollae]